MECRSFLHSNLTHTACAPHDTCIHLPTPIKCTKTQGGFVLRNRSAGHTEQSNSVPLRPDREESPTTRGHQVSTCLDKGLGALQACLLVAYASSKLAQSCTYSKSIVYKVVGNSHGEPMHPTRACTAATDWEVIQPVLSELRIHGWNPKCTPPDPDKPLKHLGFSPLQWLGALTLVCCLT